METLKEFIKRELYPLTKQEVQKLENRYKLGLSYCKQAKIDNRYIWLALYIYENLAFNAKFLDCLKSAYNNYTIIEESDIEDGVEPLEINNLYFVNL